MRRQLKNDGARSQSPRFRNDGTSANYWNFRSIYGCRWILYLFRQATMRTTVTPNETLDPQPAAKFEEIRSSTELRKLIRASLRIQNPEWIEPNGDSPRCDSYEARLAEILGLSQALEQEVFCVK
jgi:hypothetical protein